MSRWQPERKTNYLLLRNMKNTRVAKKTTSLQETE